VKIFMGASTGDLLVSDDANLARVLASGHRRVAIHAEDEFRMNAREGERIAGDPSSHPVWRDDESAILATRRILKLAREAKRRIHVLHVTTPAELELLAQHKDIATCEVTPQHLTLAGEDAYPRLGSYAQMNPPIRSAAHRDGLWHWLNQGVPDVLGSDHAPHTIEEKAKPYISAPSGLPLVQYALLAALELVHEGRLTTAQVVQKFAHAPAQLFNVKNRGFLREGYAADLVLIDDVPMTVHADDVLSKCGWSPFEGTTFHSRIASTWVNGVLAWDGHQLIGDAMGQRLEFDR
jgi:dihydroorotase